MFDVNRIEGSVDASPLSQSRIFYTILNVDTLNDVSIKFTSERDSKTFALPNFELLDDKETVTFDSGNVKLRITSPGLLIFLEFDSVILVNRRKFNIEKWQHPPVIGDYYYFDLLLDEQLDDSNVKFIFDVMNEVRQRCGYRDDRLGERIKEAKMLLNKTPYPLDNFPLHGQDIGTEASSALEEMAVNGPEELSWANIAFNLQLFAGPSPASDTYYGNRSLIIDTYVKYTQEYGNATVGVLERNPRTERDPWNKSIELRLNLHWINNDKDVRVWAGVLVHEFMHQLFKAGSGVGHDRQDFVYAIGEAVDTRSYFGGRSPFQCRTCNPSNVNDRGSSK